MILLWIEWDMLAKRKPTNTLWPSVRCSGVAALELVLALRRDASFRRFSKTVRAAGGPETRRTTRRATRRAVPSDGDGRLLMFQYFLLRVVAYFINKYSYLEKADAQGESSS